MFGERTDIGHIWQGSSSVEVELLGAANLSAPGGDVNGLRKSFQWCGLLGLPALAPCPFVAYLRERRCHSAHESNSAPSGISDSFKSSLRQLFLVDLAGYCRLSVPKKAKKPDDVLRVKSILGGAKLLARAKIFRFAILDYLLTLLPQTNARFLTHTSSELILDASIRAPY